jgi:hypothetical protein
MADNSSDILVRGCGSRFFYARILFILIVASLILYPVLAAPPAGPENVSGIVWEKTFGQHPQGSGHAIIATKDGGVAATGAVTGADGIPRLSVVTADGNGNLLWEYVGGEGTYEGNSLVQTPDGGFIVAGSSGDGVRTGLLLLKLDSSGTVAWNRTFLAGTSGQANAVGMNSDGGYVIAGSVQGDNVTDPSNWDGYILKTDDQGIEEWSRFLKGVNNDYCTAIVQTPDDGFVVAGTTDSFGTGGNDTFLVQLNAHGDEGWFTTFGGQGYDHDIGLSRRTDGGFTVATLSCNPSGTAANCTIGVIHTDSGGNELGRTVVPVPGGATGMAFATSADGSNIVALSMGDDAGRQAAGKILLTHLDNTGAIVSSGSYSPAEDLAVSGITVAGGNYAITGLGTSAGNGPVIMMITGPKTPGMLAPAPPAGTGPGDLRVTVREADTGEIATNALVYLDGSAAGLTSDSEAYILLPHVSEGGHSIRVTKDGFEDTTKTVNIEGDQNLTVFLNPSKVIPLIVNGLPEGKMNVVFVASKTQYDCTNQKTVATDAYTSNRTLFQQDVSNLISSYYLSLDQYTSPQVGLPSDYKNRFNFYYYWDKNDFADAFEGCSGTLPDHFWENAPFADVAVIVYPTYTGMYTGTCQPDGCASGLGPGTHTWVKVPADGGKLILHESGHAAFGLIDAYCGNTYYTENDPYPNVWSSAAACSKSSTSWSSSACRQITGAALTSGGPTCSKQFYKYDPEPDIMGVGVYSYFGKFGDADTTRIDYVLNNLGGVKKA